MSHELAPPEVDICESPYLPYICAACGFASSVNATSSPPSCPRCNDRGCGCMLLCPEEDYSDPHQPYFWDHTTLED